MDDNNTASDNKIDIIKDKLQSIKNRDFDERERASNDAW